MGMGTTDLAGLREVGKTLAYLKEPEPPKGVKDIWGKLPLLKDLWSMSPKVVSNIVKKSSLKVQMLT